ncbi:MAG: PadR family transcriptional regulator [Candidatus Symbiothrix sp.]|jgi:DNA-binding PadR family transcriptional regulator|nr:PadR family transcriptional regulator [Candidatus Symbiothrix sp.]
MFSQEILKGIIKPLIISLIKEEGRMYGYQITQKVKDLSSEKMILTEGALYPALHKLVDDGILTVESEQFGNRERKYYTLSESGKQTAISKLEEIKESIGILAQLFNLKPIAYVVK